MNNLIAFTGVAGSGKSTATQAITQKREAFRMSFADPIRNMLQGFGLTWTQMTHKKSDPLPWAAGKTPRQLMQTLGTEWGRELVHPDIWVMIAQARIHGFRAASKNPVVFDDCRFDNEARMIRGLGGIVVHVSRVGADAIAGTHVSEAGVSKGLIDLHIVNGVEDRAEFQKLILATLDAR